MRKICTSGGEFTPYRPWSEERKRARRGNFWTAERELIAKRMWAEGATQSAIAATIKGTKNQVAGFIFREGMSRSGGIALTRAAPIAPILPEPRPPNIGWHGGTFKVYEIKPGEDSFRELGTYDWDYDAQLCANGAFYIEGSCRLIYRNGRFFGGVYWRPAGTEEWREAMRILEQNAAVNGQAGMGEKK